jgi:hypothetical protein
MKTFELYKDGKKYTSNFLSLEEATSIAQAIFEDNFQVTEIEFIDFGPTPEQKLEQDLSNGKSFYQRILLDINNLGDIPISHQLDLLEKFKDTFTFLNNGKLNSAYQLISDLTTDQYFTAEVKADYLNDLSQLL